MKLKIADMVHYVLPCCSDDLRFRSNAMGRHRPAIVIDVRHSGAVVLSAFLDEHDAREDLEVMRIPIAHQDEDEKRPGSWHWPERDE